MKKNTLIPLVILLSFFSKGVNSMGLFSKSMFTEVEGVVLLNGEPVEGAKVISSYDWSAKDEKKSKTVTTDKNGLFSFPEWTSQSFLSLVFPMEPVIDQTIIIRYQGKEYTAWSYFKHSYGSGDEVGKSPINLICELTSEFKEQVEDGYYGICRIAD